MCSNIDLQKGVSKQEVKEYLEYINSQKYIDGKKFIEWVDLKKDLLKNYEERCDQFSGNKTLMRRIHFFFEALEFTLKDVIVSQQLYMFWNAVNQPCRFPLVPFLATILGAEIDDNQTVEETMRDQIDLLVWQMSLGVQDDNQGSKSYLNMNYQKFLEKNIHNLIPGQIFQVFSNLRENNHDDEMLNDFKELVNAIAILLKIDQNNEEERKYFVKLTELMKWCLQMSEFLGRPLTIQRALFHAYAHGLDFDLKITDAQNWIQIMKEADKSGQKPKKKKKQTGFIKKTKQWFKGIGNKLGGADQDGVEEDGLVDRIFDICAVIDNEDITKELLQNVDKMRSMVDNNNNNPTRQQKFAGMWMKRTLLNTKNVCLPKIDNPAHEKQWVFKLKELAKLDRDGGLNVKLDYKSNLDNWVKMQRQTLNSNNNLRNIMTPRRYM